MPRSRESRQAAGRIGKLRTGALTVDRTAHAQPVRDVGLQEFLDLYTEQVDMKAQLAVIYEQLRQLPDHEARIRMLEASRAKLVGACVALSAVVSTAGTWLGIILTRH
jgi:hypothetical protein